MGSKQLFSDLSFGVFPKEKVGLIGSNGAGKSTLLKILAKTETPDSGEVHQQKNLKVAFCAQEQVAAGDKSLLQIVSENLQKINGLDAVEADIQASVYLSQAGFENLEEKATKLSGGWNKRLSICLAISLEPDLLILDEPTNHLDWDGILWLESWLKTFNGSLLLVSHDREFLNNSTNRILEIDRLYPEGYLSFNTNYENFLKEKLKFIAVQMEEQARLENKARREVQWLRAGVQARTTKSRSRIDRAHQLLDDLQDIRQRNSSVNERSRIQLDSEERKTKKLIEFKNLTLNYGDKPLLENLSLIMGPKSCWGILGSNGTGKTSLLKVIAGTNPHYTGELFTADQLKIVYFDQKREELPQDKTVLQFLGEGTDYVVFKNQSVHVASYASRFLFHSDKMYLKISQLSGGEQARLLVAKLLLQPMDVLILDEPTNDLDIETIQVLEDTLMDFEGLILLVSHDRAFLNNLCTRCLALKGNGLWDQYANVDQWLKDRNNSSEKIEKPKAVKKEKPKHQSKDQRKQREKLEREIAKVESSLGAKQKELDTASSNSGHEELSKLYEEHQSLENQLLELYTKLEELT